MKMVLENQNDVVSYLADAPPVVVTAALLAIYRNQTADEKASGSTRWRNGVGFNGYDGNRRSRAMYMVRWCIGNGTVDKPQRLLTGRFVGQARRIVAKYWRQLVAANQAKRERLAHLDSVARSNAAVAHFLQETAAI